MLISFNDCSCYTNIQNGYLVALGATTVVAAIGACLFKYGTTLQPDQISLPIVVLTSAAALGSGATITWIAQVAFLESC